MPKETEKPSACIRQWWHTGNCGEGDNNGTTNNHQRPNHALTAPTVPDGPRFAQEGSETEQ